MAQPSAIAVVFSEASRAMHIAEASSSDSLYRFAGANGRTRTWLKGDHAYLAPAAVSAVLNRWNVKHRVVTENILRQDGIGSYGTVIVANAPALELTTTAAIASWLAEPANRLVVSGRTNLPTDMLGLRSLTDITPAGATAWAAIDPRIFGERALFDRVILSGAPAYRVTVAEATAGADVVADLVDPALPGSDLNSARFRIGAGIIRTEQTLYVANEPFELLGAAMQAQTNVEALRVQPDVLHWGDTIAHVLWEIVRAWNPEIATLRLRSFGSYRGVLSLRHDVDQSEDRSFLQFEAAELVPATYHVLDPIISSEDTTTAQAAGWVRDVERYDCLEVGLHNDSGRLEHITGEGLLEHVRASERRLGTPVTNLGRHSRYHVHPETLDAMAYAYDQAPNLLGMCSFSFYGMVEYANPPSTGAIVDDLITYATNTSRTIATSGFWFPFHPIISTVEEYRVLRGWDATHEYDADYELIDALMGDGASRRSQPRPVAAPRDAPWEAVGSLALRPDASGSLEAGVYTLQYHPLYARDPSLNGGSGTLPYLRWAVATAERRHFWIANKSMLHRRLSDWEAIEFDVLDEDVFNVANPTDRCIDGLWVESNTAAWALTDGLKLYIGAVDHRYLLLPSLDPQARVELRLLRNRPECPLLMAPERRGLDVVDARFDAYVGVATVEVDVTRAQSLIVANLDAARPLHAVVDRGTDEQVFEIAVHPRGIAGVPLAGPHDRAVRRRVEISQSG